MPALAAVQSSYAFVSRAHLEQAIQRELAALAAIEAVRRSACRWLEEWSGPERVKEHLACHIEARHQTEREPHLLRLADLHQQRIAVTKSRPVADAHGGWRHGPFTGVGANQRTPRIPENNQDTSPRRSRLGAPKGRGPEGAATTNTVVRQ
jgi:hypothetical protein